MKLFYLTAMATIVTVSPIQAQQAVNSETYTNTQSESEKNDGNHPFRIYADNDFFNDMGKGTDRAYTNGTKLEYYYVKNRPSKFFIDRWMPMAGDSSINTFGLGFMQTMYSPSWKIKFRFTGLLDFSEGDRLQRNLYK